MRIPSLKKQIFGDDLEKNLNTIRNNINNKIREKCLGDNKNPNEKFSKTREKWNNNTHEKLSNLKEKKEKSKKETVYV